MEPRKALPTESRPAWDERPAVRLRAVAFIEIAGESPQALRSRVAQAVEQAGGELVQVMHRLVLAAFDSASACARSCRTLGAELRAGVSCGDGLYEGGLVHGLPVIEASRLRDAAAPGQVLCAGRLVRLAGLPAEDFRALGALELAGLAAPLPAFELRRR